MIVVDTNIIAGLFVLSDVDEIVNRVVMKDSDWVAPILWKSEFRNVLSLYLRKGFLDFTSISQIMEEAERLMKSSEFDVNSNHVLNLISISESSAYDCEFVALASELGLRLVTFDKKILKEFPEIAVHPKDF